MPAATSPKARRVRAPAAVPAPTPADPTPDISTAPPPELDRAGAHDAARLLHMAGDPTRLQILLMLAAGPRNVGQLCLDLGGLGQPACSHHVGLCRHARLVEPTRTGAYTYYSLTERGRRLVGAIRAVAGAGGGEG